MKQIIANFLRKLTKLDDYIDDRVLSEIERLEREIEEIRDLANSNEYEINDRPNFYDMESHVEQLVEDTIVDVVERLETLEKA
jgi:conjugal transfer/entry exclusion protein